MFFNLGGENNIIAILSNIVETMVLMIRMNGSLLTMVETYKSII